MSVPPTRWLARVLGRRGAALVVLGLAFVFTGVEMLVNQPQPDYDRFLLHTYMPFPVRAALWIVPGVLALFAATRHGTGRDGFGFAALVVPLALRTASYVWSSVAYLAGVSTWPFAWTGALTWVALLALVLIISGWPEVPPPPRRRRRKRKGAAK